MTKEKTDYFLPRRFTWMSRVSVQGLPVRPQTGDLGPVRDALQEVVDAAGGLEYSREALKRVMRSAQEEFLEAVRQMPSLAAVPVWGGTSTPSVYYEFYNAVAWTRAVDDRCRDRLTGC